VAPGSGREGDTTAEVLTKRGRGRPPGVKNRWKLERILMKHPKGLDNMTLAEGHGVTREEIGTALAEGKIVLRGDRYVWIASPAAAEPIPVKTDAVLMIPIADIQIKSRHRQDMADLQELAESIQEIGLLQPSSYWRWTAVRYPSTPQRRSLRTLSRSRNTLSSCQSLSCIS
jgi:hypothetical protein